VEFEIRVRGKTPNTLRAGGDKIIDRDYAMSAPKEVFGEIRSDETGPTRDQNRHSENGSVPLSLPKFNTVEFEAHLCARMR
jgi:hypothetical protein